MRPPLVDEIILPVMPDLGIPQGLFIASLAIPGAIALIWLTISISVRKGIPPFVEFIMLGIVAGMTFGVIYAYGSTIPGQDLRYAWEDETHLLIVEGFGVTLEDEQMRELSGIAAEHTSTAETGYWFINNLPYQATLDGRVFTLERLSSAKPTFAGGVGE